MRSSLLICSLLLISVIVMMAQDTGAAGQGNTGQSQGTPVQATPVPQIPADQNTIRNNPYGDLMRGMEQRQGEERGPAESALPQEQTQFQLYVAQSLGSILPIYGASFFTRVPSTFAPLQNIPVPSDYILGPGDEILVRAWGQVDVDYRDTIDRNGNIYLPKVGALHVAGLPYDQLHSYVSTAVSRVFRNFQLNTSLGALRSIQVFVVGYAQRPGGYTVGSMSTLVNAVFAAGGPAPNGSMRHVLLKRGGQLVTDFDLYDLLLRGDKSGDRQLLPGDVIYFAPVGPQVAFAGSVNEPAIYELRDKTTIGDLLEFAGGVSPIAVGSRANVERIDKYRVRSVAQFVLEGDGLKRELEDGDIISISPVSARFGNAVTLRGNVAAPGRHPWHEGMRVKDLIPNLYTLVTEKYWLSQNEITRTAQWGKTLVDQNCQPGSPYAGTAACLANPANPMFSPLNGQPVPTGPRQNGFPQPYGATAPFPMTSGPYGPGGQYSPNAPYNQQQAAGASGNGGGYGPYVPYYPQYQGQPFNTTGLATSNTTTATLAGAQQLTSAAQVALKAEISRVAPEINWDYALIERLNMEDLTTHLIPFNLRRALAQPDSEDNLLLKPGDVVTIFSQEDMRVPTAEQSKYVYLEGEIKTPGVYKAEAGETLRQLVERVGGLTKDAYLFGAEFTRDSAQKEQQLRLDQAVRQFEQEIERNASQQATTNIANASGSQEQAEFQANVSSQRQLIDRLKEVKADGRIVLGIAPGDNDTSTIPNIALEDGDRFVVPSRPSFVNVVGAVYTPSSFIFRKSGRTRDYLREAGGGTRVADPKRLFVVRADGSVVAHTSGAFSGNLMGARLMPGDTIVVPEQLNKPGFMKGLKDWSYILGQIGLAAAAINVLK